MEVDEEQNIQKAIDARKEKELELQNKIDMKKDLVNEHKPVLENLSSHHLYFDDESLDSIVSGKIG